MKGLIKKDFSLILGRTKSLFILALVGIVVCFSSEGFFAESYLTLIACVIAISTISYDEFDNGYPFLFSLPITRKDYVKSKYIFGIVLGICGMFIGLIISYVISIIKKQAVDFDLAYKLLGNINLILLFLSTIIPLEFKFGVEKSRIVYIVVGGLFGVLFTLLKNVLIKLAPINIPEIVVSKNLESLIVLLFSLLLSFGSYLLSVKIIKNKEF